MWFVKIGDRVLGPWSSEDLKSYASLGQITRETPIHNGNEKWSVAGKVKGLFDDSDLNSFLPTIPTEQPQAAPTIQEFESTNQTLKQRKAVVARLKRENQSTLDLKFNRFVTPILASVVWALSILVFFSISVVGIVLFVGRLAIDKEFNATFLIVPFVSMLLLIAVRILLEGFVVLFKIYEALSRDS